MLRRESLWRFSWVAEVGAVSWFFLQALRYLLGALYAHVSSADIVLRLGDPGESVPGVVLPVVVQAEVVIVLVALVVPLLAFVIARRPVVFALTATLVAVGRVFMTFDAPVIGVMGAALTVAGAALYFAGLARQQPAWFAIALTVGLLVDQVVRATGLTVDPTVLPIDSAVSETVLAVQTLLSILLFVVAVLRAVFRQGSSFAAVDAYSGISLWGGLSFGTLLFLQFALLGLPNGIARWSGVDYVVATPWLAAVTALPLLPAARDIARRVVTLVDVQWRGWFWLLLMCLLVVIGNRFDGFFALAALLLAQFLAVLSLWWIVRPVSRDERDLTGLALVVTFITLAVLFGADFFTYEYAFVRDYGGGLDWLSSLLRAMRGLGLAVMLVAVALSGLPLMESRRRIPWQRGKGGEAAAGLVTIIVVTVLVGASVLPPQVNYQTDLSRVRIATYNIHGGYSLYFDYDLAAIASTISASGAHVVLLQEVETGRLVSFGVDQALWLGRRLGMDVFYLPANESMQGLAILSRVPVVQQGGVLLTSLGHQTGLQRLQVQPDDDVLDVYNVWLGLPFAADESVLALQEEDQWRQLQEALALISIDHPGGVLGRVVFGGTFNNTPDSAIYNLMVQTGFTDPFVDQVLAQSATLRRGDTLLARFDYLWLRNVIPAGRTVMAGDASDHRLAVVELDLTQ